MAVCIGTENATRSARLETVLVPFLDCQVETFHFMAVPEQAGRGGSEMQGLMPQFVGGNEKDPHWMRYYECGVSKAQIELTWRARTIRAGQHRDHAASSPVPSAKSAHSLNAPIARLNSIALLPIKPIRAVVNDQSAVCPLAAGS